MMQKDKKYNLPASLLGLAIAIITAFWLCIIIYDPVKIFDKVITEDNLSKVLMVPKTDLQIAAKSLTEYVLGETESYVSPMVRQKDDIVEFVTGDEISHLQDVRNLFKTVKITAIVLSFVCVVCFFALFFTKRRCLAFGMLFGGLAALLVLTVLVIFGLTNTFGFETAFHSLVFKGGNYQFDKGSSLLVRLFSDTFYKEVIKCVAFSGAPVLTLQVSVALLWLKKWGKC